MLQSYQDGAVYSITLNRSDVHNALNPDMIEALKNTISTAINNDEIRVITLTGAGKNFCAGADLDHMKEIANASETENKQDALMLSSMFETLATCPKPTIAIVNGAAFGGGVGLACACDFVIGDKDTNFCLSEVKLGLIPGVISPHIIRSLGMRQAKALSLSARRVYGYEAFQLGLITDFCSEHEDLDKKRESLISNLLKGSPNAQSHVKKLIDGAVKYDDLSQEQTDFCAEQIAQARASDDGQEGLSAFLSKRTPTWQKN